MLIVALRGLGDCGKSQTIGIAFDILRQSFPKAQVTFLHQRRKDVSAILRTQFGAIGIESQGDPGSRLARSLNNFTGVPCLVILCATRKYGATCRAVESHHPPYEIRWFEKTRAAGADIAGENEVMARRLVEEVMRALEQ